MSTGGKDGAVHSALKPASATLEPATPGGESMVRLAGNWTLTQATPSWTQALGSQRPTNIRFNSEQLEHWDSSLLLFVIHGRNWCAEAKVHCEMESLPRSLLALLEVVGAQAAPAKPRAPSAHFDVRAILERCKACVARSGPIVAFLGDCTLSFIDVVRHPKRFRWMDCFVAMQQCWASSLPIVSLVSFLIGVILAFQAALQLRPFGAAVFVADLVGLAVVREMGPMMAAVIVAGGTGAGFAAQLGNMKVGEEIDALETLGVSSVQFLALPRVVAAIAMMPILTLYANVLGILGGMAVSARMLDIPATAYWIETQNRVATTDVVSGLIKSLFFGLAVGLAGCMRGILCDRSAAGVGTATSSAVITGILLIVIADALFAVIFNIIGL